MKHFISIIIILFAINSCTRSSQVPDESEKGITDSIRHTLSTMYIDMKVHGLLAELKYLDNSPEFFWVPPGYASAIPYDAVVAAMKRNAQLFPMVNNSWDTLSITPLTAELATFTGRTHAVLTDKEGKILESSLVETGIVVKRKEGWKLFCGQTTLLAP